MNLFRNSYLAECNIHNSLHFINSTLARIFVSQWYQPRWKMDIRGDKPRISFFFFRTRTSQLLSHLSVICYHCINGWHECNIVLIKKEQFKERKNPLWFIQWDEKNSFIRSLILHYFLFIFVKLYSKSLIPCDVHINFA